MAVEESEVKEVLTKGYMNLVGGLLWAGRNTVPAMAFALSQLTRCMKTPSWEVLCTGRRGMPPTRAVPVLPDLFGRCGGPEPGRIGIPCEIA